MSLGDRDSIEHFSFAEKNLMILVVEKRPVPSCCLTIYIYIFTFLFILLSFLFILIASFRGCWWNIIFCCDFSMAELPLPSFLYLFFNRFYNEKSFYSKDRSYSYWFIAFGITIIDISVINNTILIISITISIIGLSVTSGNRNNSNYDNNATNNMNLLPVIINIVMMIMIQITSL